MTFPFHPEKRDFDLLGSDVGLYLLATAVPRMSRPFVGIR